eukprot:GHRQ01024952.1.p3 GENE.GHRQ01024952.1~~GHRQ01024952.1.p3  ORF type:complete len:107 (+),score=18.82 GHRQ01024952.1:446-766(+)
MASTPAGGRAQVAFGFCAGGPIACGSLLSSTAPIPATTLARHSAAVTRRSQALLTKTFRGAHSLAEADSDGHHKRNSHCSSQGEFRDQTDRQASGTRISASKGTLK